MPLQNRVQPDGQIIADPARGMLTGNRGILGFDDRGRLGTARWTHRHWIICDLAHPRGTYHGPQPARGWTPLFFMDEAVGLAAGHRPCAYCRPAAYRAFKAAWAAAFGPAGHDGIDRALHSARVTRTRLQVTHSAPLGDLPDGVFVAHDATPHLVAKGQIWPYRPTGYGPPRARPKGVITILTPTPTVAVLNAGYPPQLHHSIGT